MRSRSRSSQTEVDLRIVAYLVTGYVVVPMVGGGGFLGRWMDESRSGKK